MAQGLRERKKARTQAAIERAAYELALEQGFDHTTVDQIAERADVSPSTIFARYRTKDAIVSTTLDEARADARAMLTAGGGDAVDRIEAALRVRIEETTSDGLPALALRATLTDPYLRQLAGRRMDAYTRAMAEHVATERGLEPDDVRVRAFAAATTGLMVAIAERVIAAPDADHDPDLRKGVGFLRTALATLAAE